MIIKIEIPKEFDGDFNDNKFDDFFQRVLVDINYKGLCGKYEKEIAEMFIKAFENAVKESEKNDI